MFYEDAKGFHGVDNYKIYEEFNPKKFLVMVKDLMILVLMVKMRNLILKRFMKIIKEIIILVLIVMIKSLILKKVLLRDLRILVVITVTMKILIS